MRGFLFNPALGSVRLWRSGASFVVGNPPQDHAAELVRDAAIVLGADALKLSSDVCRDPRGDLNRVSHHHDF
jgi:hypothetical protein